MQNALHITITDHNESKQKAINERVSEWVHSGTSKPDCK